MRRSVLIVAFAASALRSPSSRAEVFHDGEVLEGGTFSLGFEGEALFNPGTDTVVYGHLGAGIGKNIDLGFRVGFFQPTTYFGGDVQYGLLPDGEGYPALAVATGLHWIETPKGVDRRSSIGLDGGLVISEQIRNNTYYAGYDLDVDWDPELKRNVFRQRAILGVRIVMSEHLSFLIEGGYAFKDRDRSLRNYVSGGPTLYF